VICNEEDTRCCYQRHDEPVMGLTTLKSSSTTVVNYFGKVVINYFLTTC